MPAGRNPTGTEGASPSPPTTYGVEVIARVLGITSRRVQQLAREGVFPQVARGKYPLVACVQAYIRYWQDRAEGRVTNDDVRRDLEDARRRKALAEAETAEMDLAARRAEMLTIDLAARTVERMLSVLHAGLGNFAGRWSPQLVELPTPQAARAVLDPAVDELRTTLTAAVEQAVEDVTGTPAEEGEDEHDDDATSEDDAPDA